MQRATKQTLLMKQWLVGVSSLTTVCCVMEDTSLVLRHCCNMFRGQMVHTVCIHVKLQQNVAQIQHSRSARVMHQLLLNIKHVATVCFEDYFFQQLSYNIINFITPLILNCNNHTRVIIFSALCLFHIVFTTDICFQCDCLICELYCGVISFFSTTAFLQNPSVSSCPKPAEQSENMSCVSPCAAACRPPTERPPSSRCSQSDMQSCSQSSAHTLITPTETISFLWLQGFGVPSVAGLA